MLAGAFSALLANLPITPTPPARWRVTPQEGGWSRTVACTSYLVWQPQVLSQSRVEPKQGQETPASAPFGPHCAGRFSVVGR